MKTLRFQTLEIRQFLGIHGRHSLQYRDEYRFAEDLNIITGPNASGKSTTAKAMQELLFGAEQPEPAVISTVATLDDEQLRGTLLGHERAWKRHENGTHVNLKVPAAEYRHCYRLALDDMLVEHDSNVAAKIQAELDGGCNIAQTAAKLGFGEADSRRQNCKELQERNKTFKEAQQKQQQGFANEQELQRQRGEIQAAEEITKQKELLKNILELRWIENELERKQSLRHERHDNILRLHDDDLKTLQELSCSIHKDSTDITGLEKEQNEKALELGGNQVTDADLVETREIIADLDRAELALQASGRNRENAKAELLVCRRRIGTDLDDATLECLTVSELPEQLRDHVLRYRDAESKAIAADEYVRILKQQLKPGRGEIQKLRDAVRLLTDWLGLEPESGTAVPRQPRWVPLSICLILLLAAGIAGLSQPLLFLLAVLTLVPLIVFSAYGRKNDAEPDAERRAREKLIIENYAVTGMPRPQQPWERAAVRSLLAELLEVLGAEQAQKELDSLLKSAIITQDEAHRQLKPIQEQCAQVRQSLGLTDEITPESLLVITTAVLKWHAANSEYTKADADFAGRETERKELLNRFNQFSSRFGLEPAADSWAAKRTQSVLTHKHELQKRIQELNAEIPRRNNSLREKQEQRQRILARLSLEQAADPLATVQEWMRQREETRADDTECRRLEAELHIYRKRLETEPATELERLQAWDDAALEKELARAKEAAAQLDKLREEAAALDQKLKSLRDGSDLALAEQKLEQAADELRRRRDEAVAAAVGFECVQFIRQQTAEQSSQTLSRAQEYFACFTKDAYHLEMADAAGFVARNTADKQIFGLDRLSSATRIQLLLAARLAFLARLEEDTGIKLPLFLDEILCNSDNFRAAAIMESVNAIAAAGRQVFYFTAQYDEAAKWEQTLAGLPHALTWKQILLPLGICETTRIPELNSAAAASHLPPEPAPGESWDSYISRARFPKFAAMSEDVECLHLAYLIHDAASLYRVLAAGYSTWGSIRQLFERGGGTALRSILGEDTEKSWPLISALASCFNALIPEWRQGRGIPVTQALLVSCKHADKYTEALSELAALHNGDGRRILAALAEGAVKGFRTSRQEGLRDEFIEHRAIVEDETELSREELTARLDAYIATAVPAHVQPALYPLRHWILNCLADTTE